MIMTSHERNLHDIRVAFHSKQFDSASRVLDICQESELLAPIAHSASRKMLYHLRMLHELVIGGDTQ